MICVVYTYLHQVYTPGCVCQCGLLKATFEASMVKYTHSPGVKFLGKGIWMIIHQQLYIYKLQTKISFNTSSQTPDKKALIPVTYLQVMAP